MKFISYLLGKTFDLVSGKIYESETECKYKSICSAYQSNSHTCTHGVDKSYCGTYRRFL